MNGKKRFALLAVLGALGAGAVTAGVATYEGGWTATKHQLANYAFAAETSVWPAISRMQLLFGPGATRDEEDIWQFIVREYARGPHGRNLPIAVNAVATWPEREHETPSQLAARIIDGRSPREGTPSAGPAVEDFLLKNTRPVPIVVALPPGSRFIPYAAFKRTFGDRYGWETFSGAYKVEAYLTMSRVGFNLPGTRAIVYVEVSCGTLCGHGVYYVLEKRGGVWVHAAEQLAWIA